MRPLCWAIRTSAPSLSYTNLRPTGDSLPDAADSFAADHPTVQKLLPTAEDVDGAPVKPFPGWLADLGRRAVADAYDEKAQATSYRPDVALINFYDEHAKMGIHADKDERSRAPVVSLSLGSACVFRFGNAESRGRPWHDVALESGDLFVFGGEARLAFHGVMKTVSAAERPDIGLA